MHDKIGQEVRYQSWHNIIPIGFCEAQSMSSDTTEHTRAARMSQGVPFAKTKLKTKDETHKLQSPKSEK